MAIIFQYPLETQTQIFQEQRRFLADQQRRIIDQRRQAAYLWEAYQQRRRDYLFQIQMLENRLASIRGRRGLQ